MASDIGSKAQGQWDKIENIFEDRVAKALAKLGVPSARDLKALSDRVDALSKGAKAAPAKAAAKPAEAKPATKAAPKKAAPRKAATAKPAAKAKAAVKAAPAKKAAARKPAAQKAVDTESNVTSPAAN